MRLFYAKLAPPLKAEMESNGFPELDCFIVMRLLVFPKYVAYAKAKQLPWDKEAGVAGLLVPFPKLST